MKIDVFKLVWVGAFATIVGLVAYRWAHKSNHDSRSIADQEAQRMGQRKGFDDVKVGPARKLTSEEFMKKVEEAEAKEPAFPFKFLLIIPLPIGAVERGTRFEDPLAKALGDSGGVWGGGTMMIEKDGIQTIQDTSFSVGVDDRTKGLEIIRRVLIEHGAPDDTIIRQRSPDAIDLKLKADSR